MSKYLRVLFVLMFLLSLGSLTVHAQAATSIGYIPLLPSANHSEAGEAGAAPNANLPVEEQARQGFATLAPRLLQAQATGQIVRFAPDFSAGMVMVEYATGSDLTSQLGTKMPVFDNAQAVLEYTQIGQTWKKSSPALTPFITLSINSSCFYGGNLGTNNTYRATLKDTGGHLVAAQQGSMDSDGYVNTCLNGLWTGLVPGYLFTFRVYNSAGSLLLKTYSTLISRIEIASLSPATKIARGTAPAGSLLDIQLGHINLDASNSRAYIDKIVTASSTGAWQVSFGTAAVRGGDWVYAFWQKPATIFTLQRWYYAPFIYCGLGRNYCQVYGGGAGTAAALSIRHAGVTYSYNGKFSSQGFFGANLYNGYGDPISLAAGDQASGTGAKTLTLPTITAAPNTTANTVYGKAPANRYLEVDLERYDSSSGYWYYWSKWVKSDASGNYIANFSGSVDIKPTDKMNLSVYYRDPTTGNQTAYGTLVAP